MANETKQEASTAPVIQDEGWWESILADEERYVSYRQPSIVAKEEKTEQPDMNWDKARKLYKQDQIVNLDVTGFNRGGLLVEGNGLQGFVPYSHLLAAVSDVEYRPNDLSEYVGRRLELKVIECLPENGRIVLSERAAQAGEGERMRLFQTLAVGQRVAGEVTNITDFGVFIDLGGVEGLIHISELSWGRVNHPGQIVSLGEHIDVQVLEISPERCRVALSLKRLQSNPWEDIEQSLGVDKIVSAKITSLVSFGAFAKLPNGIEGLIHSTQIPLEEGKMIHHVLSPDQEVQVRILHIDVKRQRLGLSLKMES